MEPLAPDADFPHHYALLDHVHARLKPRRYLEIGVDDGLSLRFATGADRVVGVDPALRDDVVAAHPDARLVEQTSDAFFAAHDLTELLGGPVDLAFIDGMHRFEFVLRDLANVQPHCHDRTVVLIHDCLPTDAVCASRERTSVAWAGDVWRAAHALTVEPTGCRFVTLDVAPTGMGVLLGLADAPPLADRLDGWIDRHGAVGFDRFEADPTTAVTAVPATRATVDDLLPGPTGS